MTTLQKPPISQSETTRLELLLALWKLSGQGEGSSSVDSAIRWLRSAPAPVQSWFQPVIDHAMDADQAAERVWSATATASDTLDFIGRCLHKLKSPAEAKASGTVFTPVWLAEMVTSTAARHWRRLHRTASAPQAAGDVSCGPGAFLYALHRTLQGTSAEIYGADIDSDACVIASAVAHAIGANWQLQCHDSLLSTGATTHLFAPIANDGFAQSVDLLVGNPPFVRSQHLTDTYKDALRAGYDCIKDGNFDLSVAFLEDAINRLADGGVLAYILTSKFMHSSYGRQICARLATAVRILDIYDFQDFQVFPGHTTYTCALFAAKLPSASRFRVSRFPNGISSRGNHGKPIVSHLPAERLGEHPWRFTADSMHETVTALRADSHPRLDQIFDRIIQGVRTGANHVFVVDKETAQSFEPRATTPFVSGENIRRCRIQGEVKHLIFPYGPTRLGDITIKDEEELRENLPRLYAYLQENVAALAERSRDATAPWYAFSRSQNLEVGLLRKVLIKEMMPRAEFAADFSGCYTFASGYALDAGTMSDSELRLWTAVLCTPTMEFSLRHCGTQLQSGWFRLLKHHLRHVRLPNLGGRSKALATQLANRLHKEPVDNDTLCRLDDIVAHTFGITLKQRNEIAAFIAEAHSRSRSQDTAEDQPHSLSTRYEPVTLSQYNRLHRDRSDLRRKVTFSDNKTTPIHGWYKYTQGYSASLVESLIEELRIGKSDIVLDPFAGCGTTLLQCAQLGIPAIGTEISPLMCWIARVKLHSWCAEDLRRFVTTLRLPPRSRCSMPPIDKMIFGKYLRKAFADGILAQLWSFVRHARSLDVDLKMQDFLLMAVLGIMEDVSQIRKHGSHYRFMLNPKSVGLEKLNTPIIAPDADIRPIVMDRMNQMIRDIEQSPPATASASVLCTDARCTGLPDSSCSALITSPPYLNRNNYIAQQKAELELLSLVTDAEEYRSLVRRTLRSHVEGAFRVGEAQSRIPEVREILSALSLTRNNNPKIPHMIAAYFDDLMESLVEAKRVLSPGSRCAFVVGNSRWGGVVVPVDHLLLQLAESLGFEAERILVTRLKGNSPQQMRQYGKIPVRESIIIFSKQ